MSLTAPARVDVTQSVALETIVELLRDRLGLNESQVFEVEDSQEPPPLPPGGDAFYTVAADEGTFPEGEQVPGNATEDGSFTVSCYTRIQLDQTGHAKQLLHANRRGLLKLKQNVLWALVGTDPVTTDGTAFVRETLACIRSSRPTTYMHQNGGLKLGLVQLTFSLSMDWDLTEKEE